jgi:hypothetical protein
MAHGIIGCKMARDSITAGVLGFLAVAAPAGLRAQQADTLAAPSVAACAVSKDSAAKPEHQLVRRRISMDHNDVAAPRVDNIPLEGTDSGFIPIPGTASDSVPAGRCLPSRKVSHDSAGR